MYLSGEKEDLFIRKHKTHQLLQILDSGKSYHASLKQEYNNCIFLHFLYSH